MKTSLPFLFLGFFLYFLAPKNVYADHSIIQACIPGGGPQCLDGGPNNGRYAKNCFQQNPCTRNPLDRGGCGYCDISDLSQCNNGCNVYSASTVEVLNPNNCGGTTQNSCNVTVKWAYGDNVDIYGFNIRVSVDNGSWNDAGLVSSDDRFWHYSQGSSFLLSCGHSYKFGLWTNDAWYGNTSGAIVQSSITSSISGPTCPAPPPTCTVTSASGLNLVTGTNYTFSTTSTNADTTGIYKDPPNWPAICGPSSNCSGSTSFSAGSHWVVCNGYRGAANDATTRCTGAPPPTPAGWSDCGANSRIQVSVTAACTPTWNPTGTCGQYVACKQRETEICSGATRDTLACGATNGGWSAWADVGTCGSEAGHQCQQRQDRTCTNPAPACGGLTCSGAATQYASCGCTCTASFSPTAVSFPANRTSSAQATAGNITGGATVTNWTFTAPSNADVSPANPVSGNPAAITLTGKNSPATGTLTGTANLSPSGFCSATMAVTTTTSFFQTWGGNVTAKGQLTDSFLRNDALGNIRYISGKKP